MTNNPTEGTRYYYDGVHFYRLNHPEGKLLINGDSEIIPCSPELLKLFGEDKGEKIEGRDFELQYEVWCEGWCIISKPIFDEWEKKENRRITAIPAHLINTVSKSPVSVREEKQDGGEKEDLEGGALYWKVYDKIISDGGEIVNGKIISYLASLEYRISQIEKHGK